jgi:hypothetical protein
MPILEKFGAGLQHIFEPKPAGVGDFIRCWQLMANDRFWPMADDQEVLRNVTEYPILIPLPFF